MQDGTRVESGDFSRPTRVGTHRLQAVVPRAQNRSLTYRARPTQAPAQARPKAMGANAIAKTTATGAANPSRTSTTAIASAADIAGSSTLPVDDARASRNPAKGKEAIAA